MNEIPLGDRVLKWHENLVGYVHYREMLVSTTKLVRYRCFEFEAMRYDRRFILELTASLVATAPPVRNLHNLRKLLLLYI